MHGSNGELWRIESVGSSPVSLSAALEPMLVGAPPYGSLARYPYAHEPALSHLGSCPRNTPTLWSVYLLMHPHALSGFRPNSCTRMI